MVIMKQIEDNKTIDMFGGPLPQTYTFYIETLSGERVEWTGLTRRTAVMLHNMTCPNTSPDLKGYGWSMEE